MPIQPARTIEISLISEPTIRLLAVGDICTAYLTTPYLQTNKLASIFQNDLLAVLHDKDLSMGNLECPLTTLNNPISKSGPHLAGSPESVDLLKTAKIDVAVMANNHIMDHGPEGLRDTLSHCQNAEIKTLGVGNNLQEASKPLLVEIQHTKIALLAFAEEEFSIASETTPGAARFDVPLVASAIRETKKNADLIVVNVHGGNEFYPIPSPRMQKDYRFLIDAGADAIIGHHPHVVQAIEIYNNSPIIYSLGNFLFPSHTKQPIAWHQGLVVKLSIAKNKIANLHLFPIEQKFTDGKISLEPLTDEKISSFMNRLDKLNQIASDPSLVQEFWKCFCTQRKNFYLNTLKMSATSLKGDLKDLVKATLKNINLTYLFCILTDRLDYLCRKKSTRQFHIARLKNLLHCPAHLEALRTIIEIESQSQKPKPEITNEFDQIMKDCIEIR